MRAAYRWFGPIGPITRPEIRQTGATDFVTVLHHFPNGNVWPVEEIRAGQCELEAARLEWSFVEFAPSVSTS